MIAGEGAVAEAVSLMGSFAERTGLSPGRASRRYLWTDAFAVCNLLALTRATGEASHRELALRLVDEVHHVLGCYRADDARTGWISGLEEGEGELHPTCGGLRIGKRLPERLRSEPFDERLEWDRDGQYFHYLTRWMHALDQMTRSTGEPRFNTWARELADVAHRAFTLDSPGRGRRLVWKMSTDLSRPLVASMGQHDPLDGFITCVQLQTTAAMLRGAASGPDLTQASTDFAALMERSDWVTADPLGLGGLLLDAGRVAQLTGQGAPRGAALLPRLLDAALEGLSHYARQGDLQRAASQRLAFRELGLAIGISAIERIEREVRARRSCFEDTGVEVQIAALTRYAALGSAIASFWRDPAHRRNHTWLGHRDINEVMLATCLVPEGLLVLSPG